MRSNRLHNFTFPSPFLKWGTQWITRPTNADGAAGISGSGDDKKRSSVSKAEESMATHKKELEPEKTHEENARVLKRRRSIKDEDGIVSVGKKVMLDPKNDTECEGLKDAFLRNQVEEPVRPWNLRNRQTEYKGDTLKRSTRTRGAPTWAKESEELPHDPTRDPKLCDRDLQPKANGGTGKKKADEVPRRRGSRVKMPPKWAKDYILGTRGY